MDLNNLPPRPGMLKYPRYNTKILKILPEIISKIQNGATITELETNYKLSSGTIAKIKRDIQKGILK